MLLHGPLCVDYFPGRSGPKLIVVDVPVYTMPVLQYLVCLVLLLPKVIGGGKALLLTDQFGVHLVRGLGGWLCFYLLPRD